MKNIIIPNDKVQQYTQMIDKHNMIQPILVKTDKGEFYTLPVCIFKIPKIDKVINKAVALKEIDKTLYDFPIQDIDKSKIIVEDKISIKR